MKVQCDVCQRAEATMLCCADEAALCRSCDEEIHAANKLASKHQRVPLLHRMPSQAPQCDICQEKVGYFFCLEDRALLCRQCDVAVHTATPYVAAHQRFLLTGVRVALQHLDDHNHDNHTKPSSSSDLSTTTAHNNSSNNTNPSSASEASPVAAQAPPPPPPPPEEELRWPWEDVFASAEFGTYSFGYSQFGGK